MKYRGGLLCSDRTIDGTFLDECLIEDAVCRVITLPVQAGFRGPEVGRVVGAELLEPGLLEVVVDLPNAEVSEDHPWWLAASFLSMETQFTSQGFKRITLARFLSIGIVASEQYPKLKQLTRMDE